MLKFVSRREHDLIGTLCLGDCCIFECPAGFRGDGRCDRPCNIGACLFDFGTQFSASLFFCYKIWLGDCDGILVNHTCEELGCPTILQGNGVCDEFCDIEQCGFDQGSFVYYQIL